LSHVRQLSRVEDFIQQASVAGFRVLSDEFRLQGLDVHFSYSNDLLHLTMGASDEN